MNNLQQIGMKEAVNIAWNRHWNAEKMKHLRLVNQEESSSLLIEFQETSPDAKLWVLKLTPSQLLSAVREGKTIYSIGV
ncbi:MAG: hypothetical protein ACRCYP_01600 [Alphaproteobacteria bacterium]